MNARTATVAAAVVTLLLGLAGLLYPERVIGILGLTLMRPTDPAAARWRSR